MITQINIKGFLLLIFLVFPSFCFAQKQFQHITSADGISQSEIYSFLEDARGFMWFGTVDGLNKYDGYTVTTFHTDKDNPHSITNNTIRCLAEDEIGRIWIGTDDGLCVYDAKLEKIHQIRLPDFHESRLIINAAMIEKGQLFLGTSIGLLRMDVRSNSLEQIGKSVRQVNIDNGNNRNAVVACISGYEGKIWVATATNLYQLNSKNEHNSPISSKVLELTGKLTDIRNLEEDSFGNLWIVSHNNGFLRYNPKHKQSKHFRKTPLTPSVSSNKISSIQVDKTGDLWIGTHDKGLLFLKKGMLNEENPNFQSIVRDAYSNRSLSSNLIYSLFVSRSNLLWIGTIGAGINIYDPNRKPFQYYNLHNVADKSASNTNFIRAVYADKADEIWMGTHNNGLFLLDRKNRERISKLGFGNESIFHLNDAGDGYTLVASGQGISLVKKANSKVEIMSNLPIGPTFYATKVTDGIFWVASLYGLKKCRLTNGQILLEQEYTMDSNPAISFNNCRVINFSKETNELLIGTEGGGLNVLQLDENLIPIRNSIYQKSDSINTLSNNYIRCIIKGANSTIWIGTYEGLNKMYKDTLGRICFKSYTKKEGLPNNAIQSIVEDHQQNLWIGTNGGLCKFNPKTEVFTQYTLNDGIQSNEFSEHAIFKKRNNEILIGGINGINIFFPEQIGSSNFKPNTTLTDFYLFNKKINIAAENIDGNQSPLKESISLTDSICLNPDQNSFGFDFSAMIYNAPEKIQYAYMLEGFDETWTITNANNRKANYTNLGFGNYTFKVKATNNDGLWKETPKKVFITIKTPFYYTNWAFLGYMFLALLAIVFFTNYSILKFTTKNKIMLEYQHNKKLRELETLRTRFFINVSHDLRTPLTLISSPLEIIQRNKDVQPEIKSLLDLVQRNVKKLKDMTEQLLDISKVEVGKLAPKLQNLDIIIFVKKEIFLFENAFTSKGVELKFTSDASSIKVSFDPDMLSKVLFNLLSNALKHTHKGKVTVHISSVPNQSIAHLPNTVYEQFLKIKIEDSGDGIKKENLTKVFERYYQGESQYKKGYGIGLSHSKDLMMAHHGSIEVESEKGVGSVFTIYLPYILKEEEVKEAFLPYINKETPTTVILETVLPPLKEVAVADAKRVKILLVEDNVDLRDFLSKELSKKYTVLEAANGEKGLEIAKAHFPELIISDIMMPYMDGMEFCQAIKSTLKTSHIPVILLTAKVDKETEYEGLEIGADDYISKPFELEHLLLRISNLLKNRERLRQLFSNQTTLEPAKVTLTSIDENFLANLMAKIEKGIPNTEFSIGSLERELGMSHASFYNKIKSLTGLSAKELVFNFRMKRAKQLLEDTSNIRISEVAYMVGFTDPKYFSKRFKEYFGVSPSDFARK